MINYEVIKQRRNEAWREALRKQHKPNERTAIARVKMPESDVAERITSLTLEVNKGLSEKQALVEAQRCLDCPKPTCMEGCPVEIHIPSFIKNIERGNFREADAVLRETSSLPSVCGRV